MNNPKLPLIKDLYSLIIAIKKSGYWNEDKEIDLTVGCNADTGEWSYQTGDNSYSGGAYFYPDWAVVTLRPRCNSHEIAKDIQDQLSDLYWSSH